jgi:hypothetical protein
MGLDHRVGHFRPLRMTFRLLDDPTDPVAIDAFFPGVIAERVANAMIGAAILFSKVGDDFLLMPIDPAGEHGDQDMQDHGLSSG